MDDGDKTVFTGLDDRAETVCLQIWMIETRQCSQVWMIEMRQFVHRSGWPRWDSLPTGLDDRDETVCFKVWIIEMRQSVHMCVWSRWGSLFTGLDDRDETVSSQVWMVEMRQCTQVWMIEMRQCSQVWMIKMREFITYYSMSINLDSRDRRQWPMSEVKCSTSSFSIVVYIDNQLEAACLGLDKMTVAYVGEGLWPMAPLW